MYLYQLNTAEVWQEQVWLVGPEIDGRRSSLVGYGSDVVPRDSYASGSGHWKAYVEQTRSFEDDTTVSVSCSCSGRFINTYVDWHC